MCRMRESVVPLLLPEVRQTSLVYHLAVTHFDSLLYGHSLPDRMAKGQPKGAWRQAPKVGFNAKRPGRRP